MFCLQKVCCKPLHWYELKDCGVGRGGGNCLKIVGFDFIGCQIGKRKKKERGRVLMLEKPIISELNFVRMLS